MPGTPGGPGLPFKDEEQMSAQLGSFPSFQEIRFVSGAQREYGAPKHDLGTLTLTLTLLRLMPSRLGHLGTS